MNQLIIIFTRNVQIGKVKKRLAQTLGDEKALQVYIRLLDHTAQAVQLVKASKAVYYKDYIDEADEFMVPVFHKYLQQGKHLGERMSHAFIKSFAKGFDRVVLIGCDSFELGTPILEEAFRQLDQYDAVLGPTVNGGCYLLGLKQYRKELFMPTEWHNNNVLVDLMLGLKEGNLSYYLLPALKMVEEERDLPAEIKNAF